MSAPGPQAAEEEGADFQRGAQPAAASAARSRSVASIIARACSSSSARLRHSLQPMRFQQQGQRPCLRGAELGLHGDVVLHGGGSPVAVGSGAPARPEAARRLSGRWRGRGFGDG